MGKSGCAKGGCSSSCAEVGGCPSDYVALSISIISLILLLARAASPFLIHKVHRPKGSSFWLPAIQVLASFDLLLSLMKHLELEKQYLTSLIYMEPCMHTMIFQNLYSVV